MIAFGGVVHKVPRAALATEAIVHCDGFEQGRLAGAVLASEEADSRPEHQLVKAADGRNGERVGLPVLHTVAQECDFFEHKNPEGAR